MDTWVVSTSGLLWAALLSMCVQCLFEHLFLILCHLHPGVW